MGSVINDYKTDTTKQIVDQEQYQAFAYYCPTPFSNNQNTDPMLLRTVHAACLTRVLFDMQDPN